ncbi:alpha/beta fold hydrolase [Actinokineospora pegani]|uniref:alpha/beta fold hydrolase n=1 Tax=Actinokineospora pegani TaxID=2654637 RepID=UPI001F28F599|nr:alpha/beta fold hydrolase [Actinokineospora pegani]
MEPLILLHAFPLDSRMWDRVRAPLATRTEVVALDLPGFGGTPLPDAEPSLEVVAAEVVRLLDDLGADRVALAGASLGGYVLMAMLRLAPERVGRALFTGTKATADTDQARAGREEMALRAEREGTGWLADAMLPNLLTAEDPELRRVVDAQPAATVAWYARAMASRPDSRETLRALDLDALVVHGANDPIMPREAAADIGHLTSSPVHFVDGAAHLPAFERPEAFLELVVPWLTDRR